MTFQTGKLHLCHARVTIIRLQFFLNRLIRIPTLGMLGIAFTAMDNDDITVSKV